MEQLIGAERHRISGTNYKATLSSESGRSGWCVIFRHPLRTNPDGSAKRVRRGLGTKDRSKALELVGQLNAILSDRTYWSVQARAKAGSQFSERIVDAFYDGLLPAARDGWALREAVLPLPTAAEGYARAQLLGTTGAGKSTLLRQLLGTHPATERFPSTSTAKSTVCDLEIVLSPDPEFQAVVTFHPRDQVRMLVEECVQAAAVASVFDSGKLTGPTQRLLEHSEQRFRLSCLLGSVQEAAEELSDEEALVQAAAAGDALVVTETERLAMSEQIKAYVARIEAIAGEVRRRAEQALGLSHARIEPRELELFQELFEHELRQNESVHRLVDEIMDQVEERFASLPAAGLSPDHIDWPLRWHFRTPDRAEFIRMVNRFCGSYAPDFGKLLTPLVQGLRVRGPFRPDWHRGGECKLVLLDGEGLGAAPDSNASISTHITQRLSDVDAVVLVDNAEQPVQAGPQALLRTLAASGHGRKLMICFTHFDGVKGDNLPSAAAKKQHIYKSLQRAIGGVREVLGRSAEEALSRAVAERVFFVANIHEPVKASARLTLAELRRLVETIQASNLQPPPAAVAPVYDVANLILCIPQAMLAFREPWRAKLKLPSRSNLAPEPWTRIQALSRRFAAGELEYDTLRPVADFVRRLSEHISVFLASPLRWDREGAPEAMKRQVVDEIAQRGYADLHALGKQRLFHDRVKDWVTAYAHRGTGSTFVRAQEIGNIYAAAAPVPGEVAQDSAAALVAAITQSVKASVAKSGGVFQ